MISEATSAQPEGDSDRLPWLEPYRERRAGAHRRSPDAPAAKARSSRRRGNSGLVLFAIFAALGLGVGGYWFGRETAPRQVISPRSTVIAPLPPSSSPLKPLPYRLLEDEANEPIITHSANEETPFVRQPSEPRARHHPGSRADVRDRAYGPPPAPPPPPPKPRQMAPPPLSPSPPSIGGAGEVIELGAFISERTADAALRRVIVRYPYLGTRPKLVLATPASAGWPAVYRLRLGTGSQRNARILCRYVRSIGQRCSIV